MYSIKLSDAASASCTQQHTGMDATLAGHYQIVRHLGGGGFGQTFLARDSHLPGKPLCVVKQLKPRVASPTNLEVAKRLFDREAETLYRLGDHTQIPRLLAHFEEEQEFYLVQEYIAGQPFDQELVRGQQMSEAAVIKLLQDILQVLSFVHQQQVIHRDIKPSNLIRRSRDNTIVLIDFGAVKEVSSQAIQSAGQTSMTIAIGSPGYMPCEQQSFHPRYSSDIYAVGVVCMQALTGLYPSELPRDEKTGEICFAALGDRVSVSADFASFLEKMVRYDYRQRYENATEALQSFQTLLGIDAAQFPQPAPYNQQSNELTLEFSFSEEGTSETDGLTQNDQNKLSTPQTQPISSQTLIQNLPAPVKKELEQLLVEAIGPIAPVILKQTITQVLGYPELIDSLATRLPEPRQTAFRERATRLGKGLVDDTTSPQDETFLPTASTAPSTESTVAIEPAFIKTCEGELTKLIGPIAPLIIRRTLSQYPNLSPHQLVEMLCQHLPNPVTVQAFRQAFRNHSR